MLLLDLEQGRIVDDEELKRDIAGGKPYRDWIEKSRISLEDLPEPAPADKSPVP
jgi:glutamate synthase (NADPH/NADH) large chain